MKYVLDSCVALKWVLTEADSPKAVAVRADYRNQLLDLLVPDIFPVEVAHALTRAERKGLIKPPRHLASWPTCSALQCHCTLASSF